ncbi:bromodomain-containing protein [Nafulsella turpanensis]|uniref:hypothetical protein n=1 Tax=Nafulsella turpanensis TaxID=1265690 RepID=UPI0003482594|nr:hypothetical protein [Nafulsella turpanensis]
MKFPSLIKLPKYNKFNFEPRYYDPVKEEIEIRTSKIKQELEAESRITTDQRAQFKAEMEQVFRRRANEDRQTGIIQAVFILLFASVFVGYLFYGNNAFYVALILLPIYILYRRKSFTRNKK